MAVYHDHDHDHVTTPARETTVVRDGGSSAGVLIGVIVALIIIGLIAWALFSGVFTAGNAAPAGGTQPNQPNINVDVNQPSGGAGPSNGAPAGGAGGTTGGAAGGTGSGAAGSGGAGGAGR